MNVIIGQLCVFQCVFTDNAGDPVDPTNPTIEIYYYDVELNKRVVLMPTPMRESNPPDVGRRMYPFYVPSTLTPNLTLLARFQSTSPVTDLEQSYNLTYDTGPVECPSLIALFVRGG